MKARNCHHKASLLLNLPVSSTSTFVYSFSFVLRPWYWTCTTKFCIHLMVPTVAEDVHNKRYPSSYPTATKSTERGVAENPAQPPPPLRFCASLQQTSVVTRQQVSRGSPHSACAHASQLAHALTHTRTSAGNPRWPRHLWRESILCAHFNFCFRSRIFFFVILFNRRIS